MKHMKMVGLLAAAPASASILTGPTSGATMKVGETIQLTATNIEMHGAFTTMACGHAVIRGAITENGTVGSTTNAGVGVTTVHFSSCNYVITAPEKMARLSSTSSAKYFGAAWNSPFTSPLANASSRPTAPKSAPDRGLRGG